MLVNFLLLTFLSQEIHGSHLISLYGDVLNNTAFFTRTFPWLVDNIGGDITVDYYLLGSGRYSVPQMCALYELKLNTFLQAQFLKCEAMGQRTDACLCEVGVDPAKYKNCVLTGGPLASSAAAQYQRLRIDASPVIEIGPKNTIFEVEDMWYLKKLCTIFGDDLPLGCTMPQSITDDSPVGLMKMNKKSVVDYRCDCSSKDSGDGDIVLPPPPMTSTTTVTPSLPSLL